MTFQIPLQVAGVTSRPPDPLCMDCSFPDSERVGAGDRAEPLPGAASARILQRRQLQPAKGLMGSPL
jgi:hypothetical protein